MGRCRVTVMLSGLALALSGCEAPSDPLLALSGPRDLVRFELRDGDGQPLWVIEADQGHTLRSLDYGEIPRGFRQLEPSDGVPPRPLVAGEPLVAETRTRTRIFVLEGFASSSTSFRAYASSMRLVDQLPADRPREEAEQGTTARFRTRSG